MQKRLSILVVEDNKSLRYLIGRYLRQRNCEVTLASGSKQALQQARRSLFDAFLLDIRLNETMTGIDLLAALRHLEGHAETPALACTVHSHMHEQKQLFEAGFNGHLSKPFTEEALWQAIEQVLGS